MEDDPNFERLQKAKNYLEAGLITTEDYENVKKEVLLSFTKQPSLKRPLLESDCDSIAKKRKIDHVYSDPTQIPFEIWAIIFSYFLPEELLEVHVKVCSRWKKVIEAPQYDRVLFRRDLIQLWKNPNYEVRIWRALHMKKQIAPLLKKMDKMRILNCYSQPLKSPLDQGLRRLIRRNGILFVEPNVYPELRFTLEKYLKWIWTAVFYLLKHFQCGPYVDHHIMTEAIHNLTKSGRYSVYFSRASFSQEIYYPQLGYPKKQYDELLYEETTEEIPGDFEIYLLKKENVDSEDDDDSNSQLTYSEQLDDLDTLLYNSEDEDSESEEENNEKEAVSYTHLTLPTT
eukprot:TRINITY_DN9735_c0_g1_i1.p1 TRINITY_DN9735_c0_g1~~TRINITY_DN9735_c0_g1_i1.p1  ORF type:complete len:342 (+),score=64.54 TRINITY_DN9735_c0_g1_i1:34-1059(+)